jgi:ABC-type nitrate/sulfonate/bicarbonate transport system substrate-binding protein
MANGTGQGIEKRRITLGFVPLTDCAPLVVAREKGFFERHGLDVELSREGSWATVRDKIAVEALDAGQMLAAMPLAATLGLGGFRTPMIVSMNLNLNGNAVTMSTGLWSELEAQVQGPIIGPLATGAALRQAIAARAARGLPKLRFAATFPFSSHNYLLRYWLASAGIDPDNDVRLVIVPPPRMVEHMLDGAIDGYCVGAPWGQRAVDLGVARVVMSTYDIWNNHPEKVLGTTRSWAERHPNTLQALVMALIEACRWLDEPGNRTDAARLISTPAYVEAPVELVAATLNGRMLTAPGAPLRILPDFHVFHRYAAAFPWRSHALWTLAQMCRWGQLDASCDLAATADAVYRPDIYRAAASRLGIAAPILDFKTEGTHAGPHVLAEGGSAIELGPDLFCDGGVFEPTADFVKFAAPAATRTLKEIDR